MFIKRRTRNKNGKQHAYWQLIESYRTTRGPRHRTVAYPCGELAESIGELSPSEKHGWARLAAHLDGKAARKTQQQLLLFETQSGLDDSEPVPDHVEVNLKSVRVTDTRDFGDVFLARLLPFLRLLMDRKTLAKKTDSCRFLLINTLSKSERGPLCFLFHWQQSQF